MSVISRPINAFSLSSNHIYMANIGDSITYGQSKGVLSHELYPEVLASLLRQQGCLIHSRNFGVSGSELNEMRQRITQIYWLGNVNTRRLKTPDLVTIIGGTNDYGHFTYSGGVSTSAYIGTTVPWYLAQMIKYLRNCNGGAGSTINDYYTTLPSGCLPGTRAIVAYDMSTTGGFQPTLLGDYTSVGGATTAGLIAKTTVWECRNPQGSDKGWGRVTDYTADNYIVKKIMIGNYAYENYSSSYSGDLLESPAVQRGQVTNPAIGIITSYFTDVVFVDNYNYIKNKILSGEIGCANTSAQNVAYTTGVNSSLYTNVGFNTLGWQTFHCDDGNVHPSKLGCMYLALNMFNVISNQSGWISDFSQPSANSQFNSGRPY